MTGIRLDQVQANPTIIEFADWALNATYASEQTLIDLKQAVVRTPFGRALGRGQISLDEHPRDIQVNVEVPRLARLSPFFHQSLSGSVSLDSSLTLRNGVTNIRGTVDGQANSLMLADPKINPLIGPNIRLHASINKAGQHIKLKRIKINNPVISVTGDYQLALQTGTTWVAIRISAPRLAAFSKLLATPISGELTAVSEIDGTIEETNLSGQVDATDLLIDQTDFGGLTIQFKADDVPKQPKGSVRFGFDRGKFTQTTGSADFDLDQRKSISLHNLVVESRNSTITGDISLPGSDRAIVGTLTAHVPSLAEWSDLLGYQVSGSTAQRSIYPQTTNRRMRN